MGLPLSGCGVYPRPQGHTKVPHLISVVLDANAPLDDLGSLAARAAAEVAGGRPEMSARLNRQVVTALSEDMFHELVSAAPKIYAEAAKRFDVVAKEAVAGILQSVMPRAGLVVAAFG